MTPRLGMHREHHRSGRSAWLRAAVLGANDGLISTASLVVGVASAQADSSSILLAGSAGLVAGAFSMAAGEYVSVGSQADAEQADLAREKQELATDPVRERAELAAIYVNRGLTSQLAEQVADQLTAIDPLAAHARDELGISEATRARPLTAAAASAMAFTAGAIVPLGLAVAVPVSHLPAVVTASSLALLACLGGMAARLGGASIRTGALRVALWGAVAMACTAAVGMLFGAT
jgi:VIT1/CCC1 family predicted Fe2+/Mn2+ transporter